MNNYYDHIETLRQRAKDNKAANTQFYLKLAVDSFEKLRNINFLTLFAILGIFSVNNIGEANISIYFLFSIGVGVLSYITSYFFFLSKATLYSEMENNLSESLIISSNPAETYYERVAEEPRLKRRYKNFELLNFFSLLLVIAQTTLIFLGLVL